MAPLLSRISEGILVKLKILEYGDMLKVEITDPNNENAPLLNDFDY
jgi:hypothetical protein